MQLTDSFQTPLGVLFASCSSGDWLALRHLSKIRYRNRRARALALLCVGMLPAFRRGGYADYLFVDLRKIGVIFKTDPGGDHGDWQAGRAQDGLRGFHLFP